MKLVEFCRWIEEKKPSTPVYGQQSFPSGWEGSSGEWRGRRPRSRVECEVGSSVPPPIEGGQFFDIKGSQAAFFVD